MAIAETGGDANGGDDACENFAELPVGRVFGEIFDKKFADGIVYRAVVLAEW